MTMLPLVLLPGMMCDARLFQPQITAFSGARDVFVASLTQHKTIPALASAVLQNAPPRFAVCGLSMGGIVAMQILAQAPERVERIALLDTNSLPEVDAVKHRRLHQIASVGKGRLMQVMRDDMKPTYLYDGQGNVAIRDMCMDMALALGGDVFVRQSHALMDRPDQTETLTSADIPALVLCGRHDMLCPVSRHEMMADLLPKARLVVIENAGHLTTLEQPENTNAALRRWLEV